MGEEEYHKFKALSVFHDVATCHVVSAEIATSGQEKTVLCRLGNKLLY